MIKLPRNYKLKIDWIPKKLKKIICKKDYCFTNDFENIEIEYY
jgi:hypothetical protein